MIIDQSIAMELQEKAIAKSLVENLNKWYSGHLWAATVDLRGGVAQIFNLALSGRYGFVIKLATIMHTQKALFLAGGEILERYHLSRGAMSTNEMGDLQHEATGGVVGDMT